MKYVLVIFACCVISPLVSAQNASEWLAGLPQAKDYVQKRASSYDRSGGKPDYRRPPPGETPGPIDQPGPPPNTHPQTSQSPQTPPHLHSPRPPPTSAPDQT